MGWHDLPCDIRVHLLREVVAIPHYNEDDDVLWSSNDKEVLGSFEESADQEEIYDWDFDDGPLWHDVVINTMLVCSKSHPSPPCPFTYRTDPHPGEWQMIVRDLLGTGSPAVAFASVDLAFDRFGEKLTLLILQKAIPRIRGDAEVGDDPEDVEYLAAQRLGNWLNQSIELGYQSCVRLLLAEGADPNHDYHGEHLVTELGHICGRPLAIAAEAEEAEIAEVLFDHGATLPPQDSRDDETNNHSSCGYMLLSAAAEHPHLVPFARRLLAEGVYPEERSNEEGTPLARALAANNLDMAALLLKHGACLFLGALNRDDDPHWDREVNLAARSWSVETVEWLLDADVILGESPRLKGMALTESIRGRNVPVIELLVARGASVLEIHIVESFNNDLPLSVVRLLIRHATTDECGEEDWAVEKALDMAARQGKIEVLRRLLDDGIKPKHLSITAVKLGQVESVKLMLAAGADPNTRAKVQNFGNTLYHAAAMGSMELVRLLLAHGALVNHGSQYGGDATQIAVLAGHEEVVRLLLKHGADLRAIDTTGMSPSAEALVQKLLREVGQAEDSEEQKKASER